MDCFFDWTYMSVNLSPIIPTEIRHFDEERQAKLHYLIYVASYGQKFQEEKKRFDQPTNGDVVSWGYYCFADGAACFVAND